jgi:CubicO group peptidase (beta-lactamase class C family)
LSKSFTSTAVGMTAAEGKLTVDDLVLGFFPDDAPAKPSDNLRAMRIRDLLTMSTGHHAEDIASFPFMSDENVTRLFLALPVAHKPGTSFVYNTPATYMQSAIVQKLTGQTVLDYLRPRLFEPLGISDPVWGATKQGVTLGGYGLSIRTEDIAKFGQLYLQKGQWNGRQLIPAAWVEQATARQVSNGSQPTSDWDQGYGYQFWQCRHGFYRGDGAFGQYCIVMPSLDAVVAINAGTPDMPKVMNLVWDKLVPAMQNSTALPADPTGEAELKSKLAKLALPTQAGAATSALSRPISGKHFALPANEQKLESVALHVGDSSDTLVLKNGTGEHRITCGRGAWHTGRTTLAAEIGLRQVDAGDQPVAACGAWTSPSTYVAKLCFFESPIILSVKLRFGSDFVTVDLDQNVGFGPTTRPTLVGELK